MGQRQRETETKIGQRWSRQWSHNHTKHTLVEGRGGRQRQRETEIETERGQRWSRQWSTTTLNTEK